MITQRDTYYRGYRLSILNEGKADMLIRIYHDADYLDTTYSVAKAKTVVDGYVEGWVR